MIRIIVLLAIACAIFGVGGVLGAGGHLFNVTSDALKSSHGVREAAKQASCQHPKGVVSVSFSRTKYPHIRAHAQRAIRDGWPRVLVLDRTGADQRRDQALQGIPTRPGYDRDEYPPAVGRRAAATDVAAVPSSENRSHGSILGIKLRRYCDGTRFRYVFY